MDPLSVTIGALQVPKIFRDLKDVYCELKAAKERYTYAAKLYEELNDQIVFCQKYLIQILSALGKIDLDKSEKKLIEKTLKDIDKKAASFKKWTEKNQIRDQDPEIFKKKFRAAFGGKLREINGELNKLFDRMIRLDHRVELVFRETMVDIGLANQDSILRIDQRLERMEVALLQLTHSLGEELPPYPGNEGNETTGNFGRAEKKSDFRALARETVFDFKNATHEQRMVHLQRLEDRMGMSNSVPESTGGISWNTVTIVTGVAVGAAATAAWYLS
ncbi:hypothetical protein B0J14DRAFT_561822 [Halenospora varia]|nr:hypothetical protein B0J14DRAFT_561822 [Halenospora varia]